MFTASMARIVKSE